METASLWKYEIQPGARDLVAQGELETCPTCPRFRPLIKASGIACRQSRPAAALLCHDVQPWRPDIVPGFERQQRLYVHRPRQENEATSFASARLRKSMEAPLHAPGRYQQSGVAGVY